MTEPTVGLYIIALNEAESLPRLLKSVEGAFDQIVLCDTGSADDTTLIFDEWAIEQQVDRRVVHFEWCDDFGAARQYALEQLDTDWAVWCDADDTASHPERLRGLLGGIPERVGGVRMPYAWTPTFTGYHTRATRRGRGSWAGRRHEAISIDGELATADSVTWQTHRPGGTRPFASDMYALMADLAEDPTNARAQFYLAQTHKDMGSTTLAIDAYDARVRMGGWAEEVFYAAYMGGVLAADAGRADWIHRLLAAHELRPTRVEPFYELARRLRVDGLYRAALMYADAGASIRSRDDVLFTSPWMADWGLKFEASICEYYCGEPNRCIVMSRELLSRDDVPVVHRAALESNIRCAEMLMAAPA